MDDLFYVVRVNRDPSDTHAAKDLGQAIALSMADPGSTLEVRQVRAPCAGSARLWFGEGEHWGNLVLLED